MSQSLTAWITKTVFCVLGVLGSIIMTPEVNSMSEHNSVDLIFVQAPLINSGEPAGRFPQGSKLVRLTRASGAEEVTNLTPEFFSAADPAISFDGAQILFSGQILPGAAWQVWEMDSDGSKKRQITNCANDCFSGAYLPTGEVAYTVVDSGTSYVAVAGGDRTVSHPVTFGPGDYRLEGVLNNGQLLVSANWPLKKEKDDSQSRCLYTLRPDGTALSLFNTGETNCATGEPEELDNGAVVFVRSESLSGPAGRLARSWHGLIEEYSTEADDSLYRFPRRLGPEKLVVSKLTDAAGNKRFDLYGFDLKTARIAELIFADSHLSSLQAVVLAPHTEPKTLWSTLNLQTRTGHFICLDAYASSDSPSEKLAAPVERVRVLTLDLAGERLVGEAPVEKDGSFYVAVPSDRPTRFELLGSAGQIVRAQRSWIWSRPGEQRGCVGCHASKSLSPENRWPLTLRRLDTPTRLGVEEHAPTVK